MIGYKEFLKELNYNNDLVRIPRSYNKFMITESSKIIKTFDSDTLGTVSIVQDSDKTVMVDEEGNAHSEIFNDWTYQEPPFSLLPLGALLNGSKNILMIGLGLGNVYNLISNLNDRDITSIEYDKNTAEIAKEMLGIPDHALMVGCGSELIKTFPDNVFDCVILDAYDKSGIPEVFYKKDFWDEVKRVSTKNVVITVNYCDPYNEVFKEKFKELNDLILNTFEVTKTVAHADNEYAQNIYHYFSKAPNEKILNDFVIGEYNPVELNKQQDYISYF